MAADEREKLPVTVNRRFLEPAVPLVAFGITGIGILLWVAGYTIDFQYFSIGCAISSFILAYLAWIQPRKDIVALSTPIYGIVFLSTPIEAAAGIVLQLLYAAGLTILLFRLKKRFGDDGSCPCSLTPDEPLGRYRERLLSGITTISPDLARAAGRVFIRFAEGEYEQAGAFARDTGISQDEIPAPVERAFAIVTEQTGLMTAGSPCPAESCTAFSPDQQEFLFHPVPEQTNHNQDSSLHLENALLLLYVIALEYREREIHYRLEQLSPFARRLSRN